MSKLSSVLLLFLTACASVHYDVSGNIDPRDKTVAIGPGGPPWAVELKRQLRENGWQIVVLNNAITSETIGRQRVTKNNSNARYTLHYRYHQFGPCWNGSTSLDMQASLVDNRTNQEVFDYSARSCSSEVNRNILSMMNGSVPNDSTSDGKLDDSLSAH